MTDAELEVEMASVYHPNDRIEAALAALDKMLNLPFEVFENNEIRDSTGTAIAEVWIRKKYDAHDVAELFARSPDLAAEVIMLRKWQNEAVQYLDDALEYLQNQISVWEVYDRHKVYQSTLDDINRLIAEAEEE